MDLAASTAKSSTVQEPALLITIKLSYLYYVWIPHRFHLLGKKMKFPFCTIALGAQIAGFCRKCLRQL